MVKKLDTRVDDNMLFKTFSQFGTVLSCHVFGSVTKQSLGYGVVVFLTKEAANRAIREANIGLKLLDKYVHVEEFILNKVIFAIIKFINCRVSKAQLYS